MANRLASEPSVYLRQHANNPVDWRPWNDETLAEAEALGRPILVSIGYSTCHWCHVMERESFENAEVAALLNAHFVPIKIDREELPAVDAHFMEILLLIAGRGGWPLNMFLTPDLRAFYGGTYFPTKVFVSLLEQISSLWRDEPQKVRAQAEAIANHVRPESHEALRLHADEPMSPAQAKARQERALRQLAAAELQRFDPLWGGFGKAPKFPRAHGLSALMAARRQVSDPESLGSLDFAIEHTLKCMAYGGLRDHLDGGFHRYSTDQRWLVPHFEKMLYDQAFLLTAYGEAAMQYGEPLYVDIVADTLAFLEKRMRLENGLFAAGWDADSEGEEGRFYVFTRPELESVFATEPADLRERFYRLHEIIAEGNWEGRNVLAAAPATPWSELAAPEMRRLRAILLAYRDRRVAPIRDDKAILSWNGWMASSLLKSSLHLMAADEPLAVRLRERGLATLDALLANSATIMSGEQPTWRLPRIVYAAGPRGAGFLEDHVALLEALQLAGAATFDARYWDLARSLLQYVRAEFVTADGRFSPVALGLQASKSLASSSLDRQDGANPAPLSLLVAAAYRQALYDSSSELRAFGDGVALGLSELMNEFPIALSYLLSEWNAAGGRLWKAPRDQLPRLAGDLAREKVRAGYVLLVPAEHAGFEACDFESCYLKTTDENALFDSLRP